MIKKCATNYYYIIIYVECVALPVTVGNVYSYNRNNQWVESIYQLYLYSIGNYCDGWTHE